MTKPRHNEEEKKISNFETNKKALLGTIFRKQKEFCNRYEYDFATIYFKRNKSSKIGKSFSYYRLPVEEIKKIMVDSDDWLTIIDNENGDILNKITDKKSEELPSVIIKSKKIVGKIEYNAIDMKHKIVRK